MNKAKVNRPLPTPSGYSRDKRTNGTAKSQSGYKGARSLDPGLPSLKEDSRRGLNHVKKVGSESIILGKAKLSNRA